MSRFFMGFALWAMLLALAACGGDSKGTDPKDTDLANDSLTDSILDKDSDSAKDAESGEKVDAVVSTFDDLPACTGDRNGKTAYVEDEDSAYVCKKGLWAVDDSLTKAVRPDSEKKSSSSAKAKSSSNKASDSSSSDKSPSSSSAVKTSSSSKDGKSSSSGEKSSSSSSVVPTASLASPCKTETEDNCEYGTLTDDRDGQTYKIVKIGEQWWMAENLNYAYTDVPFKYSSYTSDSTSWCYDNDAANCAKYGRLYTWAAAMDSVGTWSTNGMGCGYYMECSPTNPVRGVCPEGWHLPDTTEWKALFDAVGGWATAGIMLKSTEGWISNGNGSDAYSFSALPAGDRYSDGDFISEGNGAYFWSSTEGGSDYAYYMYLSYYDVIAHLDYIYKDYGFSVRCLKDYKSSSSEKNSSSSSVVPTNSSSSSVVPTVSVASPCKTETEDNCEYGTLTDDRDGQTYKTVKIGEQWWMAENLNYLAAGSYCYNDSAEYCEKYGRLYIHSAAKIACPKGWHLPDTTEWDALRTAVGGWATAGKMLKSTEGRNDYDGTSGNGSDAYSFSALPAGGRNDYDGGCGGEGFSVDFWSSTEAYSSSAYHMELGYGDDRARLSYYYKGYGFSVRCLKD